VCHWELSLIPETSNSGLEIASRADTLTLEARISTTEKWEMTAATFLSSQKKISTKMMREKSIYPGQTREIIPTLRTVFQQKAISLALKTLAMSSNEIVPKA
jgi:hypothetical protein